MPDRSTETTVTFAREFAIGETTGKMQAGTYRVTIDEEEITGISSLAYHCVATLFHTPAIGTSGPHRVFYVDDDDFDAAILADRDPSIQNGALR